MSNGRREIAVHLAVACDVLIDVSLPRDVLDEVWDFIGSVFGVSYLLSHPPDMTETLLKRT